MPGKQPQKKKGGRRRGPNPEGPRTQSGARPVVIYQTKPRNNKPKRPQVKKGTAEKVGTFLGKGAKAMFKAVTGFGEYKVNSNTLMNGSTPIQVQNSTGGFILRHREYIRDINPSEFFVNSSAPLNPGMSTLFPVLSGIAQNFEQYQWRGVIFEYKSMSSGLNTATTTSSLGTVIMATQYNATDVPFPDKRTMENYEFANSVKPSEFMVHPIECARSQNTATLLYVRTGDVGPDEDLRLYDLGNFQIATQGMPATFAGSVIGELWVTYEVEFFKPKLTSTNGTTNLGDKFLYSGGSTGSPLGTINVPDPDNTCGCTLTASMIKFPQQCHGQFMIIISAQSSTAANTTSLGVGGTNFTTLLSAQTVFKLTGAVSFVTPQTGSTNQYMTHMIVNVSPSTDGSNPNITFSFTGVNSDWSGTIYIVQVPPL